MRELIRVNKKDGSILFCAPSDLAMRVINSTLKVTEIRSIEDMGGYDITEVVIEIISWFDCHNVSEQLKYNQACNLIAALRDQLNERSSK